MSLKRFASRTKRAVRAGLTVLLASQLSVGGVWVNAAQARERRGRDPQTPIQHVIVIIGENRSFDHVFATYVPKNKQTVRNLLSEGIVNADGTPGPNFSNAAQNAATDAAPDAFLLSPAKSSFPGDVLPAPLVGGPKNPYIPTLALPRNLKTGCRRPTTNT